jgi:hypothetical protein
MTKWECSLNVGLMSAKIGLLFGIPNFLAEYLQEYSYTPYQRDFRPMMFIPKNNFL